MKKITLSIFIILLFSSCTENKIAFDKFKWKQKNESGFIYREAMTEDLLKKI